MGAERIAGELMVLARELIGGVVSAEEYNALDIDGLSKAASSVFGFPVKLDGASAKKYGRGGYEFRMELSPRDAGKLSRMFKAIWVVATIHADVPEKVWCSLGFRYDHPAGGSNGYSIGGGRFNGSSWSVNYSG